jgi:predicted Zn-dependent peptidase
MFNETILLMAECLMQADFDKSWVERTRADLIRDLRNDTAPPFEKAYGKLRELLYQDNGYRRPPYGSERVIRTVSPEDLRKFHSTYYIPNNTVVAVVGDVTPELAVERVKLAFAGWVAKPLPKRLPVPDESADMFRSSVAEADTEVAYLMMGWLAPSVKSVDFAAVSVAGNALGGGKGSLMFRRLRQEMGMGYEIGTAYPRLRNQSHLMAYVATDPFKFDPQYGGPSVIIDEVKTNLLKMVDELKTTPLTNQDIQRAKGYTIGQFAMTHQHLSERASDLAWFETVGVGYDMYQRFPDEIEKVTAADVLRVVQTYLDKYAVVVLLPKGRPSESH